MLYVRYEGSNGLELFIPIRDDNVYIQCETCGEMKLVEEPLGLMAELGCVDGSFSKNFNECDECSEKRYILEDEYCRKDSSIT